MLHLSKIVMHKFWYDYAKPKYRGKTKLCYMDKWKMNQVKKS